MKRLLRSPVLGAAFAFFAMLFGSGNIVFPLGLGRDTGSMGIYGMIGFFLTAVLVPLLGIIAMALYNGDYTVFLQRAGKFTGFAILFLCMALVGPFCVIPRSIAISYAAISWIIPSLSMFYFSIFMAFFLYGATVQKSGVIALLSRFLGPLKLGLLSAIVIKGLVAPSVIVSCTLAPWQVFSRGLLDGYGTLDLLGVIFFSGLLIAGLSRRADGSQRDHKEVLRLLVKAGCLGAIMLGLVYSGFVVVAAHQSGLPECMNAASTQLLSILASVFLGAGGGILASLTIAIACMTTAIALTTVFAEYLSKDLFSGAINYRLALLITIIITVFFANYGFEGIMNLIAPVVEIVYPALIALAIANIIYKIFAIDWSKQAFYVTLAASLLLALIDYIPTLAS